MNTIGKNIIQETRDIIWNNIRNSSYDSTFCNINVTIAYNVFSEEMDAINDNTRAEIFDNVGISKVRTFNTISPITQKLIKEQILNNDKN